MFCLATDSAGIIEQAAAYSFRFSLHISRSNEGLLKSIETAVARLQTKPTLLYALSSMWNV
jgi:hypothetical protein